MGIGKNRAVPRQLRVLFNVGVVRELTDGQLLERFATDRGEAAELAFAVIVERHGPMVLRVCRGVLGHRDEAQDAFQATFLVLVKRAHGLWVRDSIGPWLHQVAYRTACCARGRAARHRRLERLAAREEAISGADRDFDLETLLHEEIDRLPERFRSPVILCDLEGRSYEQVARHLGWPVGTVKSRLSRGRERLRDCLIRRGVGPEIAPAVVGVCKVLTVPITSALLDATTAAALKFAAVGSGIGGTAVLLAEGVLRTMTMSQWWKVAAALVVAGATASGAGWVGAGGGSGKQARPAGPQDTRKAATPTLEVRRGKLRLAVTERGYVEAGRAFDIFCNVEGTTTIIRIVPEGTAVQRGEIIAELDSARLRDQLVNQRITTKSAEANYLNAKLTREVAEIAVKEYKDIHEQDVAALTGTIDGAGAAIRQTEARLKRNRDATRRVADMLRAGGGAKTPADIVAEIDLQDRIGETELSLERERRSLAQAKGKREILRKYTYARMIKNLESVVRKAHSDELARQATWELEHSKENKLEKQIANCTLVAPVDGCVIYANDPSRMWGRNQAQIEEGAKVRERQKIVSIVDFNDPMRINVKVPEKLVDQVAPKMKARIKIDAFPSETINGLVIEVAPLPDPGNFFSGNAKVFTTRVQIGGGRPNLRPGMTATAEIVVEDRDDAIGVPVKAVAHYDGKHHVAVKRPDGDIEWRDVVLGHSDGTIVVVKEGLRAGDQILREAEPWLSDEQRARKDAVIDPFPKKAAPSRKAARKGARSRPWIVVADRAGAIRVPVKAVFHYDAKDHVAVIRPPTTETRPGGGIEWRVVVLGSADGSSVEVKEGLRSGDRIIIREAETPLTDDQRARLGAMIDPSGKKADRPEKGPSDARSER